jgi:hypothetical protein
MRPALIRLLEFLGEQGVEAAIMGGVAASALGVARFTHDIDATVLLPDDGLAPFFEAARRKGLLPRLEDYLDFARTSRMVLLTDIETGVDLDIALAGIPFEYEALERRRELFVGGIRVPIVSPEDLVIMKAVAGRPQDLEDVRNVLRSQPGLDLARIRERLREFAGLLDDPELAESFERALRGARPGD